MTSCHYTTVCLGVPVNLGPGATMVFSSQPEGMYAVERNYFVTVVPAPGFAVTIGIVSMNTEASWDFVTMYTSTAGPFQTATFLLPSANILMPPTSGAQGASSWTAACGEPVVVQLFSDNIIPSTGLSFTAATTL